MGIAYFPHLLAISTPCTFRAHLTPLTSFSGRAGIQPGGSSYIASQTTGAILATACCGFFSGQQVARGTLQFGSDLQSSSSETD